MTTAVIFQGSDALEALLDRVRTTREGVGARFPLFANPATGRWTTTRRGSWTGGYWTGLLWLRALATNDDADWTLARVRTAALTAQIATDTVTRGMTFWYGAAIGDRIAHDERSRCIAIRAARALARAWDPTLGVVPTGRAFAAAPPAITIDGVVGLVPLLAWAAQRCGDERLHEIAARHAERHLELCLRADGSIRSHLDPPHGEISSSAPAFWARGQAWGMLALTQAAQWLAGAHWIAAARRASDWWLEHVPGDHPAPWDLADPTSPSDTSATAIAAVALQRLGDQAPHARTRYHAQARRLTDALTTHHLTPRHPDDRRPRGMLLHGCYDRATPTAEAHELIWGSFFLTYALTIQAGLLAPNAL